MFLLPLALAAGCAQSSRAVYGKAARYEAAERAWVASRARLHSWVFRDPVTGCVLRCRSDVQRWASINVMASHARNKNEGAMNTALVATLPLTIPAAVLLLPAIGVSAAVQGPSAKDHRAKGDDARARGAFDEAATWYGLAVFEGDKSAGEPLAQVLIRGGREAEAVEARRMLLCSGARLGEEAWSGIESWLRAKGVEVPRCEDPSTEPVPIEWED